MKITLSQIAHKAGVSVAAVSKWGLDGTKEGRKFVIDTQNDKNNEILTLKGVVCSDFEKAETPAAKEEKAAPETKIFENSQAEKPSFLAALFTDKNFDSGETSDEKTFEELQAQKIKEEIVKLRLENEKNNHRLEFEKAKVEFEKQKAEAEKRKIDVERLKLEKETQKIEIEIKRIELESKKYVKSQDVQSLLEETITKIIELQDNVIIKLDGAGRLKPEDIHLIQKIFSHCNEDITQSWGKILEKGA